MSFKVFKRSARNWEEFARARKYKVDKGLTYDEARRLCQRMNETRTKAQIRRGTVYEFTSEK